MRAYTACWLAILAVTAPEPAFARTDARVIAIAAQLDIRDPQLARIELALRFLVRSGPISSFELEGLDPDFELLELEAPTGASAPQILQDAPGQLQLVWSDPREAPKPGEHSLRIVYATRHLYARAGEPRSRVAWTLPRWPERLSNVQVTVLGPPGLTPAQTEPNWGEQVELVPPAPNTSRITFTRAELPRLTGYRVQCQLPPLTAAETAGSKLGSMLTGVRRDLVRDSWLLLIGLCLGALIVAKRRVRRRRLVTPRMLVPQLEPRAFDWPIFGVAALAPLLVERAPILTLFAALAAVASALERERTRRSTSTSTSRRGCEAESSCDAGSPRAPQWLSAHAALDATTPAGVLCLAALLAAAMFAPEPLRTTALVCGWLATPLFFSGTRLARTQEEPGS